MLFLYNDYGAGSAAAAAIVYLVLGIVYLVIALGGYLLTSFFLMKIFTKAGVEGKWRAWVPLYNMMIFFKLGDISPWFALGALLAWIPVLGYLVAIAVAVLYFMAAWRIGLKLQKEAVWLVLAVLLSIVWLGINAFDKSRWNLAVPAAPWANSFLRDTTVWKGVPSQVPAGGFPYNPVTQPPAGYPAQPPAGYPAQPPAYPAAPPAAQPPAYPTQAPAGPATPPPAAPPTQPPAPPQA